MQDSDLGIRIRDARKRVGLAQSALAKAIGLDQSAVSRIENGGPVTSTVLSRIADALGEPLWALFRPKERLAPQFRAVPGVSPTTRAALDYLDRLLDDLAFLRELGSLDRQTDSRRVPANEIEDRRETADFQAAPKRAVECRRRIGLEPESPVPDIIAAVEAAGVDVALRPLGDEAADGIYVRRGDAAIALLNSNQYQARLPWSAAHELGHHEMGIHGVVVDDSTYGGKAPAEQEADAFAAEFLVPRAALRKVDDRCDTPDEVAGLAREYGVSYPAMVFRLGSSNLIRASHRDWLLQRKPSDFERGFPAGISRGGYRLPFALEAAAKRAYLGYDISLVRLSEMLERDRDQLRSDLNWEGLLHPEDSQTETTLPGASA